MLLFSHFVEIFQQTEEGFKLELLPIVCINLCKVQLGLLTHYVKLSKYFLFDSQSMQTSG